MIYWVFLWYTIIFQLNDGEYVETAVKSIDTDVEQLMANYSTNGHSFAFHTKASTSSSMDSAGSVQQLMEHYGHNCVRNTHWTIIQNDDGSISKAIGGCICGIDC
ncbi:unnamed protein product [Rotaria sp. Silwood2]|nr:unnamed protein product [Rotaria sp. Silwood2]CAF4495007.1 unnamed protein product [Rotaria sp. Silwood2]